MNWELRETDIRGGKWRSTFVVVDFDSKTVQLEDFEDAGLILDNCIKIKAKPACAQYMQTIFLNITEPLGYIERAKDVSEDLLYQLEKVVDKYSY